MISVLIVDDHALFRAGLRSRLELEQDITSVGEAATAEEAAVLAAHHAIDFAIVDVELAGDADGADLAHRLHERWGLKVLFVSGGSNAHLVSLPMALGFVGKPFSVAELLAAVTLSAALLERRST